MQLPRSGYHFVALGLMKGRRSTEVPLDGKELAAVRLGHEEETGTKGIFVDVLAVLSRLQSYPDAGEREPGKQEAVNVGRGPHSSQPPQQGCSAVMAPSNRMEGVLEDLSHGGFKGAKQRQRHLTDELAGATDFVLASRKRHSKLDAFVGGSVALFGTRSSQEVPLYFP